MLDLLQQVNLLEDLSLRKIIFHVALLDGLDRHIASCQFMHTKRHFSECALPNELHELVELE